MGKVIRGRKMGTNPSPHRFCCLSYRLFQYVFAPDVGNISGPDPRFYPFRFSRASLYQSKLQKIFLNLRPRLRKDRILLLNAPKMTLHEAGEPTERMIEFQLRISSILIESKLVSPRPSLFCFGFLSDADMKRWCGNRTRFENYFDAQKYSQSC